MVWRWLVATSFLLLPLMGCGGGSPVTSPDPSVPTGSVEGRLVTVNSTTSKSRQGNIRFRARVHGLENQNTFDLQIRAKGYFRIDNVPAGEQVISVEDETSQQGAVFVCLVRPGQVTNVGEIELSNLASISGTVTDPDGKPIARVRIVALPINSEDDTVEQLPARLFFTALTGKNGNYKLLVPAGAYLVEARHPNYETASQTVMVEESSSVTLDFQLVPLSRETATVVGKVMAELSGTLIPVPGALVLLRPLDWISPWGETVTEQTTVGQLIRSQMNPSQQGLVPPGRPIRYKLFTFTKADGTFELTGVPAGTYTAIAYKPGYGRDTKTVEVKAKETARVEFLLRTRLGILQGQVTDASTGQPLEKALVFAVKWGDIWFGWEDWEKSDNGKWVRPMAGGGKGGHRPTIWPPVEPPTRAGTLTDSNGNYSLVLPAGDYFVVSVKEGYTAQGQQVILVEGQTVQVNFSLQPASSVE